MTDFGATYDEMTGAADKLDQGKDTIESALDECQGYVDELVQDGFKTEKASGKFQDGYTEMTTGLKDAIAGVEDMAQALRDMATAIQDLDSQLAGG
jgi:uncharacterized protein YukE